MNANRDLSYANGFPSWLRPRGIRSFTLNYFDTFGRAYFGWMDFCGSNPEWRSHGQKTRRGQALWWSRHTWRGMRAVPHFLSYNYTGIHPTTEENHTKTSFRVAEKCQLGTIRFVDRVAVAAATDCNFQHPWLALRVGQVNPRSVQISPELTK
jgi:hypothetical protein